MINHVKTLLANEDSSKSDDLGFIIDPSFTPVRLTGKLKDTYESLMGSEIDEKRTAITAVAGLLARVDLEDLLDRYDSRVEEKPKEDTPIFGGFDKGSEAFTYTPFLARQNTSYLFSRTRDDATDKHLEMLKKLFITGTDGYITTAAAVLALVARLELKRTGREC